MKWRKFLAGFLFAETLLIAAPGSARQTAQTESAKREEPDAGRLLLRSAFRYMKRGQFETGRLKLIDAVSMYSDSALAPAANLAVADSFYLQGGYENLTQAEHGYRQFLEKFPGDALEDSVMLAMARSQLRRALLRGGELDPVKGAETELEDLLRLHPRSRLRNQARDLLTQVREYLAAHELKVAVFYYEVRDAPQAAQQRTEYILENYPNFSQMDAALYYHARALADQGDFESATQDALRLICEFPQSAYAGYTTRLLSVWGVLGPGPPNRALAKPARLTKSPIPITERLDIILASEIKDIKSQGAMIDLRLGPKPIAAKILMAAGVEPAARH